MSGSAKIDLSVDIGGMVMKNPVTVASGTFGYGVEYVDWMDVTKLGAITVKGIRLEAHQGNRLPRYAEVPGGMVNAIGLQGPGVAGFEELYMPALRGYGVPVIVNIWGTTVAEYAEVAARLSDIPGIDALEINVSCPNVAAGGSSFGTDLRSLAEVVGAVRRRTTLPVIPKLAPNVSGMAPYAVAAVEAGADALALVNTLPALVIDVEERRPVLANRFGGLSGAGLHPVALKHVYDASQAVDVPIIGMGGIFEPREAIAFLIAGAAAVAVGTANFIDPTTPLRVLDGIEEYLRRHGFTAVRELSGSLAMS